MTPTITVHEQEREPDDWPILFAADGEPLVVEVVRVKVIGFGQGKGSEREKATRTATESTS